MARRTRDYKAQRRRTTTTNREVFPALWQGPQGIGKGLVKVQGCDEIFTVETPTDLQKGKAVVKVGSAVISAAGPRPGPSSGYAVGVGSPPEPLVFPDDGPGGLVDFLLFFRLGTQVGAGGYYVDGTNLVYAGQFGVVITNIEDSGRFVSLSGEGFRDGDRSFIDSEGRMVHVAYSNGEVVRVEPSPGWQVTDGQLAMEVQITTGSTASVRPVRWFSLDPADYTVTGPTGTANAGTSGNWGEKLLRGGDQSSAVVRCYVYVNGSWRRFAMQESGPGDVFSGVSFADDWWSSNRRSVNAGSITFNELVDTEFREDGVEYRYYRFADNGIRNDPEQSPDFFEDHPQGNQFGLDAAWGGTTGVKSGLWILRSGRLADRWSTAQPGTTTYLGQWNVVGGPSGDPIGISPASSTTLPAP